LPKNLEIFAQISDTQNWGQKERDVLGNGKKAVKRKESDGKGPGRKEAKGTTMTTTRKTGGRVESAHLCSFSAAFLAGLQTDFVRGVLG